MSKLKEIRQSQNLSQRALAERMNMTPVAMGRHEREDHRLTLPLLRQYAGVLECSISMIAGDTDLGDGKALNRDKLALIIKEVTHLAAMAADNGNPYDAEELSDCILYLYDEAPAPGDIKTEAISDQANNVLRFQRSTRSG